MIGAVAAWTVHGGSEQSRNGGVAFDVMLPNGEWRACLAADENGARETVREIWNADQQRLSTPSVAKAAEPNTPVDHWPKAHEVAGIVAEGKGFWKSCCGCHELNEGHPTGPWSIILGCNLGMGCHECGGIGAVWDTTDYADMGDFLATPPSPVPDGLEALVERLRAPMRFLSRTATEADLPAFQAHGDSMEVNEGDFWRACIAMPDAADAITALIAERDDSLRAYEQMNDAFIAANEEIAEQRARAETAERDTAAAEEVIRAALAKAKYVPGDHPIVPVKIHAALADLTEWLAGRPK